MMNKKLDICDSQMGCKGRFTWYDFLACDKLTTDLQHELGTFTVHMCTSVVSMW